jgi:hypothetical protein
LANVDTSWIKRIELALDRITQATGAHFYPHATRTLPARYPHATRTLPARYPHATRTLPAPSGHATRTLRARYPHPPGTLPAPSGHATRTLTTQSGAVGVGIACPERAQGERLDWCARELVSCCG